jgi:hypothetical protein
VSGNNQFFKMLPGDFFTLICLLGYAVFAFLFVTSSATISKMAVFGWIMGAFMFIAPIVSILSMNMDYAKIDKQKNEKISS